MLQRWQHLRFSMALLLITVYSILEQIRRGVCVCVCNGYRMARASAAYASTIGELNFTINGRKFSGFFVLVNVFHSPSNRGDTLKYTAVAFMFTFPSNISTHLLTCWYMFTRARICSHYLPLSLSRRSAVFHSIAYTFLVIVWWSVWARVCMCVCMCMFEGEVGVRQSSNQQLFKFTLNVCVPHTNTSYWIPLNSTQSKHIYTQYKLDDCMDLIIRKAFDFAAWKWLFCYIMVVARRTTATNVLIQSVFVFIWGT